MTQMIDEHVQPDTFTTPLYTFPANVRKPLNQVLEIFKSQFAQEESSIGTTHLTKCKLTQVLKTCLTEAIPHCLEVLQLYKE